MKHGQWTAKLAQKLAKQPQLCDYTVLFDHGQTGVDPADKLGKIASWIGKDYKRETILGYLDIAVVEPKTKRVIALLEIEESAGKPKTLMGDIFATLLGEHVSFQGKRQLVGEWTTLLILAQSSQPSHQARLAYLQATADQLTHSPAANARIGHIVLDRFADEVDLESKAQEHISAAIKRAAKHN